MQDDKIKAPGKASSGAPSWDDLRIFYWVVAFGSFNKAAENLEQTQPTLSRRVEALEHALGVTLVERSSNGVTPTEAGRVVYDHVHAMQSSVRELARQVDAADSKLDGTVKLRVPDGLLTYWLTPRLRDFQRANPLLSLEFVCFDDSREGMQDDVHLSIQFNECKDMDAVAIPLGMAHYLPYASREYLSIYGEPKSLQDLVAHRYVYHTSQRYQSEGWDHEILALKKLVNLCYVTNSSAAMVQGVRSGLGIGMLPTYFATFEDELVQLDFELKAQAKFWLTFQRERGQIARVRAVIEWIKSCFNKNRMPWFADRFIHPSDFDSADDPVMPPK